MDQAAAPSAGVGQRKSKGVWRGAPFRGSADSFAWRVSDPFRHGLDLAGAVCARYHGGLLRGGKGAGDGLCCDSECAVWRADAENGGRTRECLAAQFETRAADCCGKQSGTDRVVCFDKSIAAESVIWCGL